MSGRGRGVVRATYRRRLWIGVLAAGLSLAGAACSSETGGTSSSGPGAGGGGNPVGADLPKFASDFERTCVDGIGFPGSPAYKRTGKGPHLTVLMSKGESLWTQQTPSDGDYPRGWLAGIGQNMDKVELVVCYEQLKATPAGKTCQMEDQDTNEPFTVTMYNTQYRLRILEVRTGKQVHTVTADAKSTECPTLTFVSGDEDRTKYYTEAQPRDYRAVLQKFIAP